MADERSRFYLLLTIVLLVMVLVGFTPTFYLRPFFEQPPRMDLERLPGLYVLHGIVMTAWFGLLVVQSALVNVRRQDIHRNLGWGMAVLAVLVVGTGVPVLLDSTPRNLAMGVLNPADMEAMKLQSLLIYNDVFSLMVFAGCIAVALLNRTRRVLHRTMVLVASMAFMAPAVGRILPLIDPTMPVPLYITLNLVLLIATPVALVVHDLIHFGRFPGYAFAGACLIVLMLVLNLTVPETEWGYQFFLNYLSG